MLTSHDSVSIEAHDNGDIINFIFESYHNDRYSNFELKLNDNDPCQLDKVSSSNCAIGDTV